MLTFAGKFLENNQGLNNHTEKMFVNIHKECLMVRFLVKVLIK